MLELEKVGGAEGDVQRFDNSVDSAFDRGVQDVADAPDDVARFAGDQVRPARSAAPSGELTRLVGR